jgi:ABC-type transport system substrate-binding protein
MNTFEPPFDNLKLRQAVTHAIDRQTLADFVLPNLITPAYTMLMKGFPGEHVDQLQDYQKYDPELAKQLIAEAGYPDGQGLPALEMWMRGTGTQVTARDKAAAEAVAAMLGQNLGLNVSVRPTEVQTFNEELYAKRTILYFLPYQFDFLDASNMIGIWRSTGRHAWKSDKFDELIVRADGILDDPEARDEVFFEAERTLLEDAPAAFVFHPLNYHIWRPYVVGSDLETNFAGFRAVVYLNTSVHRTVYINNLIGS